jgi:glycosyltransferase involved in cell wall biosynthesis
MHTHGYRSDVIDGGVARRAGIPVLTTVHGFTRARGLGRIYEWLQRWSHRRFDAVVAVSRPQTDELAAAGVARRKLHLLQNAWSDTGNRLDAAAARAALGVAPAGFHIGWVGRLSEEKGGDLLVDALHTLSQTRNLPFQVSVIGEGPCRAELAETARRLGLAEHIRWHGLVENASSYFAGFDVFVLSSRTEGTPIVLFEAMAAGVPIVATRVGGVPDVVNDEEAFLVAPGDTAGIASAIASIREQPELARKKAAAAMEALHRRFDVNGWLMAYESIYKQLRKPENQQGNR